MSPFQEAMLKFEQALQESLAVEQARQAAMNTRQPVQGRPAQRPTRPGGYPAARPGGAAPTQPAHPVPVQDAYETADMDHPRSNGEVYLNVGEHAVVPSVTESVYDIVPQVSAFDEPPATTRNGTKQTTTHALSAAPQAFVPLAPSASPLMQGIIWTEVLGRPVSRRRGRGRHGI